MDKWYNITNYLDLQLSTSKNKTELLPENSLVSLFLDLICQIVSQKNTIKRMKLKLKIVKLKFKIP
jgi:hypothetical protein